MNAEIRRDRMKPENIEEGIGRDHWDYANDRFIRAGKGWNYYNINPRLYDNRILTTGTFPHELDDSLARDNT